ncbi:hypothetical protein QE152_g38997 [Popillia japonica]|uniref:Uncharacterized protein n=1 Tax=Popillia japonica TaxID=7064 RepID=A0AAW1HV29_POPJA
MTNRRERLINFKEENVATNLRRRLKTNAIPTQKISKIPHPTKEAVIDRSKRHWLQKCTLNMMEETSTNTEAHDENPPPLTTKTGTLIPFFAPLSHIFYGEKATENNYQRTRARTNTREQLQSTKHKPPT